MNEPAAQTAHAAALDDAIDTYLRDGQGAVDKRLTSALILRDAIEHGWYGATADIAERLESVMERAADDAEHVPTLHRAILARLVRELTEELKREVGA